MSENNRPVCQCEGWWEQDWYGRQPMTKLRIAFESNRIHGSGVDIVGPFSLSGIIGDGGAVVIQKQYIGSHCVEYVGAYDGEGSMAGEWRIDSFRGRWLISIRRVETDSTREITERLRD